MRLTIDRATWARGPRETTRLLSSLDGSRCCLGFHARACGVSDAEMLDLGWPEEVVDRIGRTPPPGMEWLVPAGNVDSDASHALMAANDDEEIDEPTREARIAALFAAHGVEVEFVGPVTP